MRHSFISVGVNHWQTPLEVLEKFSMTRELSECLINEALEFGVKSIFTISTCNRTQVFALDAEITYLNDLLVKYSNGSFIDLVKYGFALEGEEAIDNLFKVSTGLDSQILGDIQVFSQVKSGVEQAKKSGAITGVMDRLLQFVFQAYKDVQSYTNISKGAASVAHAAVLFVRNKHKNLGDKNILLFGTGEMGKRTLENITSYKFSKVTVINRTYSTANVIAEKHSVHIAPFEELGDRVKEADIVMVATGSENYTLEKTHLNGGEKLLIDLSVPRNINPNVMELGTVDLADIEKLSEVADETLAKRKEDIPKARGIIEMYKAEFEDWRKMRTLGPTIKDLNLAFEAEKADEIRKYKGRYTEEELQKLKPLVDSILKRISSKNIEYLRKRYRENEDVLAIFREMYSLDKDAH
ncbi:MAG: glutamyl-tRNA reductase [Bacteroidetes bacterium]|nr:MAG: glutamyl-tRNA reductase [Bacteroidota bacterium]